MFKSTSEGANEEEANLANLTSALNLEEKKQTHSHSLDTKLDDLEKGIVDKLTNEELLLIVANSSENLEKWIGTNSSSEYNYDFDDGYGMQETKTDEEKLGERIQYKISETMFSGLSMNELKTPTEILKNIKEAALNILVCRKPRFSNNTGQTLLNFEY